MVKRMNELVVIKLLRDSLLTTLIISAPILGAGMIIGLIVAIFQTTTSIQEQTLTFVPKIVAIFFTIILFASWIIRMLVNYSYTVFEMIEKTGVK